jgi:hypothetical protein
LITPELRGHLDVSAASGLICHDRTLHVVADDELFLDSYDTSSLQRTARLRLLEGELPQEHAARKRAKPDFESLTWLGQDVALALGSGSAPGTRERGVRLLWNAQTGAFDSTPQLVDLRPLYDALRRRECPGLNIEGAAVQGDYLRLLQRGAKGVGNAVIDLLLSAVLSSIQTRACIDASAIERVLPVRLGELSGVGLSFTDACTIDNDGQTLLFSAAAERTDNAYDDGECVGSVIGVLDADGSVGAVYPLLGRHKVEGIVATRRDGLLLVADPDNRDARAPVLRCALPGPLGSA